MKHFVAMYVGEDGAECLYVSSNLGMIKNAVTNFLAELREQAGLTEDEVQVITPKDIVDGEKIIGCLAHSYDGNDWFDAVTIEAVEVV